MKTTLTILMILMLAITATAHEENTSESCSIDPNASSGCGYDEGQEVATDHLDIKGYSIDFHKEQTIKINQETKLAVTVHDPDGNLAEQYNVQIQIINPRTSQEIYYSEAYEETPGKYSFRWNSQTPGEYYVQFLIRAEDEIIKPTFAFIVTDARAEKVFLGALIAGILIALTGIYFSFKKKFQINTLLTGLIIGVVVVGLGYSVAEYFKSGGETGFTVCGENECQLAVHWHSQLHINLCGEEYKLPLEAGDLNRLHTHKELNRLHFHALILTEKDTKKILEPEKLSLEDFFSQLEIPFNSECFGEYCNGKTCPDGKEGKLTMTVNDEPNTEYEKYSYKDGDDIHITFG